jgi:hypothetical protein
MSEKDEIIKDTVKELKTPIYTRNANKRYYEKKKNDPEYMKKKADNAREWRAKNKEKHNEYQKAWYAKQKEEKQSNT